MSLAARYSGIRDHDLTVLSVNNRRGTRIVVDARRDGSRESRAEREKRRGELVDAGGSDDADGIDFHGFRERSPLDDAGQETGQRNRITPHVQNSTAGERNIEEAT